MSKHPADIADNKEDDGDRLTQSSNLYTSKSGAIKQEVKPMTTMSDKNGDQELEHIPDTPIKLSSAFTSSSRGQRLGFAGGSPKKSCDPFGSEGSKNQKSSSVQGTHAKTPTSFTGNDSSNNQTRKLKSSGKSELTVVSISGPFLRQEADL
jgi:hypothetical protein